MLDCILDSAASVKFVPARGVVSRCVCAVVLQVAYLTMRAENERVDIFELLRQIRRSAGSLTFLQLCLRAFPDEPELQEAACTSIARAAADDGTVRMQAGKLEIFPDLHAAMKRNHASLHVQVQACLAVCSLVEGHWENQILAVRSGILENMKDAVRRR
eukprot:scaffold149234_cov43-Prasinocladus_malaysianus.AAC.1